jgi:glycosyltransferase involved in cell wall biosynthesis
MDSPQILALATQGIGGDDETRLRCLLSNFSPKFFPFDRNNKRRSFFKLLQIIQLNRPNLVVMEGTGLAGGLAVLLGRLIFNVPYVISSGDAVGPFVAAQKPFLGPFFGFYERILCRLAAGFIGWTPYLTGRALTFGMARAMTAAGWAPFPRTSEEMMASRARVRAELGIQPNALVIGIIGSLAWTNRVGYCYGYELVKAITCLERTDVHALIVGDGDGRERLTRLAGVQLNKTIFLTGRVTRDQIPNYLAAMDIASLPQSVDSVGSFRYTTKLSEYLAAGLPVVTGQIPLAYDFDGDWLWRLPGASPWDERYINALTRLLTNITTSELIDKHAAVPRKLPEFDRARQVTRVTAFLEDLLDESRAARM